MRKNILNVAFVAAIAMVSGINMFNVLKSEVKLSDVAMANVQALAGDESWIEEWWDSEVYTCQSVQGWHYDCMPYKDVPKENGDWEMNIGEFQPDEIVCGLFKSWDTECVGGSDVAHCWDCE